MEFWSDLFEKFGVMFLGLAAFAAVVGIVLFLADRAPKRGRDFLQLAAFLSPALILLAVGLVYPAIRTTILAFFSRQTANGSEFVGLDNFVWMFTQPEITIVIINTLIWVALVPLLSTIFGLAYAVFIDKSHGEKVLKSLVFMPMAISFVGAGIIWRFMYEYREVGFSEQIGLLNQILVWLGQDPQPFLVNSPWNTFFLIVVMVWIQTGFAMVLLSAAIKGVPVEIIEAARLDGANAWQSFWNVTVPGIRGTLVVVVTTISIATLKVFDIVRAMTGGQQETQVLANYMYDKLFVAVDWGVGSASAMIILLLVTPILVWNVWNARKEMR